MILESVYECLFLVHRLEVVIEFFLMYWEVFSCWKYVPLFYFSFNYLKTVFKILFTLPWMFSFVAHALNNATFYCKEAKTSSLCSYSKRTFLSASQYTVYVAVYKYNITQKAEVLTFILNQQVMWLLWKSQTL